MGFLNAVLACAFFLSFQISAKDLDVGVDHIQDPMTLCHCENPGQVGRICIAAHKWRAPELPVFNEAFATKFVPSIQNNEFVLFSEAFYNKCQYGLTSNFYTDPVLQARENAKGPSFDHVAVLGKEPLMSANVLDQNGDLLVRADFTPGKFEHLEAYFSQNSPQEFYRVFYPGQTTVKFPIDKVLTPQQIRNILDKGFSEIKIVKSTLAINTLEGTTRAFGEYVVTLRFHRKAEVTLADVQKDPWNTSFIRVGVEQ